MKKLGLLLISLVLVFMMVAPAFAQPIPPDIPYNCSYYEDGQHRFFYETEREIISITPCTNINHMICVIETSKVTTHQYCACGAYTFSTSFETLHRSALD